MLIVKKAHRGFRTVYQRRYYHSPTNPGAGWYGFECDSSGNVFTYMLEDKGLDNYIQASTTFTVDGYPVYGGDVHSYELWESNCAVGQCNHCDRSIMLNQYSNQCECGAEYNIIGQEVVPYYSRKPGQSEELDEPFYTDSKKRKTVLPRYRTDLTNYDSSDDPDDTMLN